MVNKSIQTVKFIQTVKAQIEYFDYMLKKHSMKSAIQAKFWPLKYEFEQLLGYLETQPKQAVTSPRKPSAPVLEKKHPPYVRAATLEIENSILQIIKSHPNGIHTTEIRYLSYFVVVIQLSPS